MGGKSSSSSKASTTTNAIDKRQVVSDGVGISADNSSVSYATSTSYADSRSFTDNSQFTLNTTTIDAGAVQAGTSVATRALDVIRDVDAHNRQTLDDVLGLGESAIGLVRSGDANTHATLRAALDFANEADGTAAGAFREVLGVAGDLFTGGFKALSDSHDGLAQAYATARELETTQGSIDNRTLTVMALAAAGVAAIAMARKS